jgi:hypothetical protein
MAGWLTRSRTARSLIRIGPANVRVSRVVNTVALSPIGRAWRRDHIMSASSRSAINWISSPAAGAGVAGRDDADTEDTNPNCISNLYN